MRETRTKIIFTFSNISLFSGRPDSSLTVASDCSSTISTEDEETVPLSPSPSLLPNPPEQLGISELKNPGTHLSPATKSRLANLFKKIPKFSKDSRAEKGLIENNSSQNLPTLHSAKKPSSSQLRTLPPPPSSAHKQKTTSNVQRTRSMSSDNGFGRGSERGSYRAPKGQSRYMQAAEAYRNKSVSGTWSSATPSRSRPALASDTFTPRPIRTASASPAPTRKRFNSGSKESSPQSSGGYVITSTQSTPSRKPIRRSESRELELETDEMILRRMEEILFTYKSKVEDRLAAEGKELPKDIFQDFTEHWINSSPYRAKSVDSLDSGDRSIDKSSERTPSIVKTRKDTREGYSSTKIPVPTFYKNSMS